MVEIEKLKVGKVRYVGTNGYREYQVHESIAIEKSILNPTKLTTAILRVCCRVP